MEFLLYLFMAGFVLFVLWSAVRPRWHFKIVVRQQQVDFIAGIPETHQIELRNFLLNDLKLKSNITILGRREQSGRLVISILGTKDNGLKQRIRNFLLATL